MRPNHASLLPTALLPLLAHAQWPNPEPLINGPLTGIRDPSLIRRASDGQYFLFSTNANGVLHTAPSLSGPWTNITAGALIPAPPQTVVAPQAYAVAGTYYLYYSQHTTTTTTTTTVVDNATARFTANVHVAWSASMDPGTWTEGGALPIPANNAALLAGEAAAGAGEGYNVLDASLLVVPTGAKQRYFLSFGSFYQGLFQAELASPTALLPKETSSPSAMNHLERNSTGNHATEGSFQFAWPTDGSAPPRYYLFFSSGRCCHFIENGVPRPGNEYKIMVCRADAPTGPFFDAQGRDCLRGNGGTLVLGSHDLIYAPGGQGVMYSDEVDSVVLYYHYTPANSSGATPVTPDISVGDNGAIFGWNYLAFDGQGWPVVTAGVAVSKPVGTANAATSRPSTPAETSAGRRRIRYPWAGWF